jgi:hypothetical protein
MALQDSAIDRRAMDDFTFARLFSGGIELSFLTAFSLNNS